MALSVMREGVAVLSRDGEVLFCTPLLGPMLGLAGDLNAGLSSLVAQNPTLGELVRGVGSSERQVELVLGEGGAARVRARRSDVASGGTVLSFTDLGLAARLEERLGQASRYEALSRLSDGLAHEVRNPLNAMAINLEVLGDKLRRLEGSEVPENLEKNLRAIREQIAKLDGIVRRFSDFAAPRRLAASRVDLSDLLSRALAVCSHEARKSRVEVRAEVCPELVVEGDEAQLGHAVLSLVLHGIAGMPEGGNLAVGLTRVGDEVLLEVVELADEGSGLRDPSAPGEDRFGLHEVERIVDAHGGNVVVKANLGAGTSIVVRLPAKRPMEAVRRVP